MRWFGRACIVILPLALIGFGLWRILSPDYAALVVGSLVWLDIQRRPTP